MGVTVEGPNQGKFRWTVIVHEDRTELDLDHALTTFLSGSDGGTVQLWIRDVDDIADRAARRSGFEAYRDLWQLRCPLPNAASGLRTRGFTPDDLDEFVALNNRALHWHPEQGGLTADAVRKTMSERWFDPDGFRLLEDDEGALIGFCWTKVDDQLDPPLGEIYVIAIDPSQHGRGLGKPMTLAGLEWLSDRGLRVGMLYVESDNEPANATYAALGFERHHTDRAYRLKR